MTGARDAEHRDSGVEWIGAIPADWELIPFFAAVKQRRDSNVGMREKNLLSLSFGRIVAKDIDSSDGLLPESFETYQIVEPSDVVFRLTDLQNDKRSLRSAFVREKGIITSAYLAVAPIRHDPTYFAYLMRAYDSQKVFYSMGGGLRQSMKFEDMKHLPVLLPSLAVQRQIADYLDVQTAKIDALIGKQERLIVTLAERRQAVISHLTSTGLAAHSSMGDSGYQWIGSIPSRWKVFPLLRVTTGRVDYRGATPVKTDHGIQLITARNVKKGYIDRAASLEYVSEADYAQVMRRGLPEVGDLLLTMEAPLGNAALVDDAHIALAQRVIKFRLDRTVVAPEFLSYLLNASAFQAQILSKATGSTALGLKASKLSELVVALPPLDDQTAIVDRLDFETSRIDRLAGKAREMIEVLKERRQALISAAVTGKIDVRGLV